MGDYYLALLKEKGLTHSQEFEIATENIEQGNQYYDHLEMDEDYREEKMVENFIREYQLIVGEPIMGIYGDAHVNMDNRQNEPNRMVFRLQEEFGDVISYQSMMVTVHQ